MKDLREEEIEEAAVIASGGNVFADLGLPDAEELLAKSAIAMKINQILDKRHLSQTEAAALLGINLPRDSCFGDGVAPPAPRIVSSEERPLLPPLYVLELSR